MGMKYLDDYRQGVRPDFAKRDPAPGSLLLHLAREDERRSIEGSNRVVLWVVAAAVAWLAVLLAVVLLLRAGAGL